MDRDELREKIIRWLYNKDYDSRHTFTTWEQARDFYRPLADSLLSLLAPVLADAEKWRVLEKKYPNFCKRFDVTIDALEGEGEKG